MIQRIQNHMEQVGAWWCRLQHTSLLWPIDGEYTCATCGRHYPVPWGGAPLHPTGSEFASIRSSPIAHGSATG